MTVSKLIKIMAGLAITSLGLAAPAQADARQDQDFYWLLTDPNQDHPMVIWNFALVRSLGIATCQREDAGDTPYAAAKALEHPNGPYTWDVANDVASAAETIYCSWHHTDAPNSVNTSNPVYPPPAYPPQVWYPERSPEMPPPGAGPNW
jgi:hypothetical protein